jgi:hypothetical protein
MVSWFEGPKLEANMAPIALILCILWPGFGQIIIGAISKPLDQDPIIVGIVMIIINILMIAIIPYLVLFVITIIAALTFGVGSVLYIVWPFSYLLYFAVWGWSVYYGYKTYVKSKDAGPVNTTTTQQPQQPQEPQEQPQEQPQEPQQPQEGQ